MNGGIKRFIVTTLALVAVFALQALEATESGGVAAKPCPLPHGKWEPIAELSDEFNGATLEETKWYPNNPIWLGRMPGYFNPKNVRVKDGMLHLDAKLEDLPDLPKQYHTFTTAAVQSKAAVRYGYFEVRAQAMDSLATSAFWFYRMTPEQWTEIDVFELSARKSPHGYLMAQHVFHTLVETVHWQQFGVWQAPYNLSQEFHRYGMEWNRDDITFWVDGKAVRKMKNTHWHQALTLNFDSETFPTLYGLPQKDSLPATFSIDYVRAWRRLDGPLDDKPLAVEFRFPGRKSAKEEARYRLKTDSAGVLIVRIKGGEERPDKVLLEYNDEAFFAAQTGKEIHRKVLIRDTSGKQLGFDLLWNRQPRTGKNENMLKAATPNGYNPSGVEVLTGKEKTKGASDDYEFKGEGGAVIKVTVQWP